MEEFLRRLNSEPDFDSSGADVCNGTFLSRSSYVSDIDLEGFKDGRLEGRCAMTAEQVRDWTAAGAMDKQAAMCSELKLESHRDFQGPVRPLSSHHANCHQT
jgi:hypothetical protein